MTKTDKQNSFVTTGGQVDDAMFELIDTEAKKSKPKYQFYESVLNNFRDAWLAGIVPRVTIGVSKSNSQHRGFYIRRSTLSCLRAIAECDGVDVAAVLRTAFAWHFQQIHDPSNFDVFGSDRWLPNRRKVYEETIQDLNSDIENSVK